MHVVTGDRIYPVACSSMSIQFAYLVRSKLRQLQISQPPGGGPGYYTTFAQPVHYSPAGCSPALAAPLFIGMHVEHHLELAGRGCLGRILAQCRRPYSESGPTTSITGNGIRPHRAANNTATRPVEAAIGGLGRGGAATRAPASQPAAPPPIACAHPASHRCSSRVFEPCSWRRTSLGRSPG